MATSSRSTFARKYELHQPRPRLKDIPEEEGYDQEKEDDIALLEQILEGYHWYNRDLLLLYLEEGSYRKVEKATGIPFKSVGNTVKKTIESLRSDYYDHTIERIIRSCDLAYIRGGADDGLEDQGSSESS